jgi:hypothetical protein
MADIITELASKAGINSDLARKGLGALLAFVKEKLPADSFSKILSAIPGSDNMMAAAAETGPEPSAGVLSTITGLAGKLFGGAGGATALATKLAHLGFSADQLQKFVPTVLEFLKNKLPPDIMNKITSLIPLEAK